MHRTVNSRWGIAKYFAKDEYVGKSLHYYGEYGPDETEKILSLAVPGKLCLDIGANIGVISMALEASGFEVMAFEPQPQVYNVLRENVRGECYNFAMGSGQGFAEMPIVHYSERNNVGGLGIGMRSIYGSYQVPVKALDSLKLDNVGFMKIDVEGYEREVLLGAEETIARCAPIMYIEDDRYEKSAALRDLIRAYGYEIEEHKPTLYREENFFGLKRNIWDKNYASHNLICVPKC